MDLLLDINPLSFEIIGSAIEVHTELGPGLLESTYETCLEYMLLQKGFKVERQKSLPVKFQGIMLDAGYRIDLLINDLVLVELKSVDEFKSIHKAQVMTYLKLSGIKLGLLINFNVTKLKNGIHRIIM